MLSKSFRRDVVLAHLLFPVLFWRKERRLRNRKLGFSIGGFSFDTLVVFLWFLSWSFLWFLSWSRIRVFVNLSCYGCSIGWELLQLTNGIKQLQRYNWEIAESFNLEIAESYKWEIAESVSNGGQGGALARSCTENCHPRRATKWLRSGSVDLPMTGVSLVLLFLRDLTLTCNYFSSYII